MAGFFGGKPGLVQTISQMLKIRRIEKFRPKFRRIEGRIDAAYHFYNSGRVFSTALLGIGGR